MILTERIAHAVAAGKVTVAYRRWKQPRVKPGTEFRTVAGLVRVETIKPVAPAGLSDADARQAGYATLDDLTATFRSRDHDPVFRIGLSWVAADVRDELAAHPNLTAEDITGIDALLDRLDARTPWARTTLARIQLKPGITAGALTDGLTVGKESLKRRIRTLKEHGLTRSLRVGYELSERGHAYLRATDQQ
ncbi:Mlr6918 protein [Microbacterium esteraromaticum]|uniref:Mlr6918 protein n=1 Tax=Microbacterium esteraromaticum TaxID=57043 RepID=A0A1R4KSZ2_9MICO|nr:hypothetical protein [Microbacterium esteraromaticum]SJN47203.1 Mlr6918 protein [Microbacterium esteraromaticum]